MTLLTLFPAMGGSLNSVASCWDQLAGFRQIITALPLAQAGIELHFSGTGKRSKGSGSGAPKSLNIRDMKEAARQLIFTIVYGSIQCLP
jgi:hypothetical protein